MREAAEFFELLTSTLACRSVLHLHDYILVVEILWVEEIDLWTILVLGVAASLTVVVLHTLTTHGTTLFLSSRFISTFLMKYVNGRLLLAAFGCGAALCSIGAIVIVGMAGLYCLVGISFFMSLMFPTIYGIALEDVDSRDHTLGAAFLVMAIVGGALMPPLQGMIIDQQTIVGHPAVNVSFVLPLFCFILIIAYGWRSHLKTIH